MEQVRKLSFEVVPLPAHIATARPGVGAEPDVLVIILKMNLLVR